MKVIETRGDLNVEVAGISCDSRKIRPREMFAAVPGTYLDGHEYIPAALKKSAGSLLVSLVSRITPHCIVPAVVVPDVRLCMGQIAARLLKHPDHKLTVIAVTGTNGKTTITFLIESILLAAQATPGVVGTVNYRYKNVVRDAPNTTPESIDLLSMMAEMAEAGVTHAVIEVSSHALDQRRVAGIRFAAGIYTNLSRDHLDYHQDMEDYFQAKRRLFTEVLTGRWQLDRAGDAAPGISVINLDDPYGRRLKADAAGKVITYGIESAQAAVRASQIGLRRDGSHFHLTGPGIDLAINTHLPGRHNVMNVLAAAALAISLKVPAAAIQAGIENLTSVPGRLEPVANAGGLTVLVDYAHTPDALSHALRTCREITGGRVIVVFGAGGDRDRGKRPLMGGVAVQNADLTIVTSDNPRTEEPLLIIDEILAGIEKTGVKKLTSLNNADTGYMVEPDRKSAIRAAIKAARPEDIVLIAGKGHEDYQIIGKVKHPFDDRVVAREAMEGIR